jgi:putative membrane protein
MQASDSSDAQASSKSTPEGSEIKDTTRVAEIPSLLLKGFFMGSADVVPGVSGGTMALILGIYTRLIDAIKSVDLDVVRSLLQLRLADVFSRVHWFFLITLLSGVFTAIIFFTRVVKLPELMFVSPEPVYGLFFGLIVGSVWFVGRSLGKITVASILWIIAGTAIGLWVVTLVPVDTSESAAFVFMSGALAITAMILPGISGSFILLILRKYDYILSQFGRLGGPETMDAILVLVPFALGMVVGIVIFSRILSWFLHRYNVITLCVLIGFMIGSLYVIWPFQNRIYAESVRERTELSVDDPLVRELMVRPESTRKPEYRRLLSVNGNLIITEMADLELDGSGRTVIVERIKPKLLVSEPFVPLWSKSDSDARLSGGRGSVSWGLLMMLAGFLVVVGIEMLARRKNNPASRD